MHLFRIFEKIINFKGIVSEIVKSLKNNGATVKIGETIIFLPVHHNHYKAYLEYHLEKKIKKNFELWSSGAVGSSLVGRTLTVTICHYPSPHHTSWPKMAKDTDIMHIRHAILNPLF